MSTTTTLTAPERTYQQQMQALKAANQIRARRSELKRELKAGRRSVEPLLSEPPAWLESMKLFELLLSVPKIGRVKASKVLARSGVSPSKTVRGLSPRQRQELLAWLRRGGR